jgi:hypothetical protein
MVRGPRSLAEMTCRLLNWRSWEFYFGTPDRVPDWHLYAYEYVDDLKFMPPATELFRDWELGEELLLRVGERFREEGWDGNGVFQVFWLPPFVGVGPKNVGCHGLLVKQDNDGISWIASPVPLPWVESIQFTTHPIYDEFLERGVADGRLRIVNSDEE